VSDIPRWQTRLTNFERALAQLDNAAMLANTRALNDLELQGLIKAFELVHELAWRVLKDYFAYQGDPTIRGSRDAFRTALSMDLIADGDMWMQMIVSRNRTVHTYDESVARDLSRTIVRDYLSLFKDLANVMRGEIA
jgi:nucleotidyltransferase substrate binding protein (TIGR01987 family)